MKKRIVMPYYYLQQKLFSFNGDWLIGSKSFSRRSQLEFSDFEKIVKNGPSKYNFVLDMDVLLCERDWSKKIEELKGLDLTLFKRVRCQDPGVIEYFFKETSCDLEVILETGHHNWPSIKRWCDYLGSRLKKVVLSYELSKEQIAEYSQKLFDLGIESELLVLGEISLFYSPRKLLQKHVEKEDVQLFVDSEESPHKNFPVVQNQHGTFMFHLKKLSLVDRFETLQQTSLTSYRIESIGLNEVLLQQVLKSAEGGVNLKAQLSFKTTRGYFDRNKSNVLFSKLRNENLSKQSDLYIGEVVSVYKGRFLGLKLKNRSLEKGQKISITNSEGKTTTLKVNDLKNSKLIDIKKGYPGDLVLMNYVGRMTPRSVVSMHEEGN